MTELRAEEEQQKFDQSFAEMEDVDAPFDLASEMKHQEEKFILPDFSDGFGKGSFVPRQDRFVSLEMDRMAQFNKETGGSDCFKWKKLDNVYQGLTLKHFIQNICTYNSSNLYQPFMENIDNTDTTFDPAVARKLPEYFADSLLQCPDPSEFDQVVPY